MLANSPHSESYFLLTGLPFAVADDPGLQQFVDDLLAAGVMPYFVPTRQQVGTKLLDRVFEDTKKETMAAHKLDPYATLLADFQSNRISESVININLTGKNGSTFVGAQFPSKTEVKNPPTKNPPISANKRGTLDPQYWADLGH